MSHALGICLHSSPVPIKPAQVSLEEGGHSEEGFGRALGYLVLGEVWEALHIVVLQERPIQTGIRSNAPNIVEAGGELAHTAARGLESPKDEVVAIPWI